MSEKPPEEIYASFRQKRTINAVLLAMFVAFVVSAIFFIIDSSLTIAGLSNQGSRYFLTGTGIAIFLAEAFVWACPSCKRHLGRHPNPKKCPHCGIELRPPK